MLSSIFPLKGRPLSGAMPLAPRPLGASFGTSRGYIGGCLAASFGIYYLLHYLYYHLFSLPVHPGIISSCLSLSSRFRLRSLLCALPSSFLMADPFPYHPVILGPNYCFLRSSHHHNDCLSSRFSLRFLSAFFLPGNPL